MRRLILVGSLVMAVVIFLPFAGFMTARNVTPTTCSADGISQPITTGPEPTVSGLSQGQVRLAKIIWLEAHNLGSRLRGPADQAAKVGIAVASQATAIVDKRRGPNHQPRARKNRGTTVDRTSERQRQGP